MLIEAGSGHGRVSVIRSSFCGSSGNAGVVSRPVDEQPESLWPLGVAGGASGSAHAFKGGGHKRGIADQVVLSVVAEFFQNQVDQLFMLWEFWVDRGLGERGVLKRALHPRDLLEQVSPGIETVLRLHPTFNRRGFRLVLARFVPSIVRLEGRDCS